MHFFKRIIRIRYTFSNERSWFLTFFPTNNSYLLHFFQRIICYIFLVYCPCEHVFYTLVIDLSHISPQEQYHSPLSSPHFLTFYHHQQPVGCFARHHLQHVAGRMARTPLYSFEKCHSAFIMAFRLFRYQAPAFNHRRTHQCHTTCHGPDWCAAGRGRAA